MATRRQDARKKTRTANKGTGAPGGRTARGDAAETMAQLDEIVREVARLGDELRPFVGGDRGSSRPGEAISGDALRRFDLMAAMLAHESGRLTGGDPAGASNPSRRTSVAFSTLPSLSVDDDSVGLEVPGLGSVTIGTDGASASVDGVGSARVGKDGVSVTAGGVQATVGGNGASVSVPGGGSVRVGTDGSISVQPGKGGESGSPFPTPGLPFPPIPCLEACEFKIPIPVPKFVAEPFEISIGIPRIDANPVPISIPIPTPAFAPWQFPIAWPQLPPFPQLPQFPNLPSFPDISWIPTPAGPVPIPYPNVGTSYNPAAEGLVTRLLTAALHDVKDDLKTIVTEIRDWNDAAGDQHTDLLGEARRLIEPMGEVLDEGRDALKSLNDVLTATMGEVTPAGTAVGTRLRHFLREILGLLDGLIELRGDIARAFDTAMTVANPVDALTTAVRTLYLVIGWIVSRVTTRVGYSAELVEAFTRVGQELDAALAAE